MSSSSEELQIEPFKALKYLNALLIRLKQQVRTKSLPIKQPSFQIISGKLLADLMTDDACKAYGSFPDRLYVVHRGKIAYQGGRGPFGYKVCTIIK